MSGTVLQAAHLEQNLGDIKAQLRAAVQDVGRYRPPSPQRQAHEPPHPAEAPAAYPRAVPLRQPQQGPAPLDDYLVRPKDMPVSSPYPNKSNGTIWKRPGELIEAEKVLEQIQMSRAFLDQNLDTIQKARRDVEVYSLVEMLTVNPGTADLMRLKMLVEEHIQDSNPHVQKAALQELLKQEEDKDKLRSVMIPERDTSGIRAKPYGAKVAAPHARPAFGSRPPPLARGKAGVEAKVDSGLKTRLKHELEAKNQLIQEKAAPQKKTKKPAKMINLLENRSYVSRVYGKTPLDPQRTTTRDTYMHFKNDTKTKVVRTPTVLQEIPGTAMATAKTQTSVTSVPPAASHFYFDVTKQGHQPQSGPLGGQLVPMAIPLGKPRQDPAGHTPMVLPSLGPVTSSLPPQPRVGLVTVRERSEPPQEKKKVDLQTEVLPSVDIASKLPDPMTSTPKEAQARSRGVDGMSHVTESPKRVTLVEDKHEEEEEEDDDADESEDTYTEEVEGAPVDLPGFHPPTPRQYHGPAFPPQAPPSSDTLAADIKRRDLLQHQAMDWVEQELMAQVLGEMYANRPEAIPHTPAMSHTRLRQRQVMEEEDEEDEETQSDVSQHDSFIADAVGQAGLQLFIDAGQPLDDQLVNALVKEVIQERIAAAVGQRTSHDDEGMRHVAGPSKTKPPPQAYTQHRAAERVDSPPEMPSSPVPTPEPTPRHSPITARVSSRDTHQVSPPDTPEVTPAASLVEEFIMAPVEDATDEEPSLKDPVTVPKAALSDQTMEREFYIDMGAASTPSVTPIPSPAAQRTPSPSLYEPTPEPSLREVQVPTKPTQFKPSPVEMAPIPVATQTSPVSYPASVEPEQPASPSVASSIPESEPERKMSASSEESVPSTELISETVNDKFSEGQWLVSVRSEGEFPLLPMDEELRERVRHHLVSSPQRRLRGHGGHDDTLLDTDELDPDLSLDGPDYLPSEGEFLTHGRPTPDPQTLLNLLASMQPPSGVVLPPPGVDKSLGEVSFAPHPSLHLPHLGRQTSADYASPGEMSEDVNAESDPAAPPAPRDPPASNLGRDTGVPRVRKVVEFQSPPQPVPQARPHPTLGAPMATGENRASRGRGRPGATNGGRSRVVQVSEWSGSPEPPRATGSRPLTDTGLSQSLQATSDLDTRTMTPDQINVNQLLRSNDYLGATQSTHDPDDDLDLSNRFDGSGRFYGNQTLGSTSDMSLPPGLTHTLERSSSSELKRSVKLTYPADGEGLGGRQGRDLRQTLEDPEEGTGEDMGGTKNEPHHLLVTMPSMGEDSSTEDSQEGATQSEFSLK